MMDLYLILPDGAELAYGPVPGGFAPLVGEVVGFQRSDPYGQLVPDDAGLEGPRWMVLGREWNVREKPYPHERVIFLTLRLGASDRETP